MTTLIGGIEAGGTKFVCAVGTGPDDLRDEVRFPTTTPEETLGKAIAYFQEQEAKHGPLAAIGIAAFGPLDPNPQSPTFGLITTTPKPHWANADVVGALQQAFPVPIGFDTDVNGAALAEHRWGAAQDVDNLIYMTIGTGIGGGVMVNGRLVHGLIHPELGHISLPHDWQRDPYKGRCPYHGDCLEGMAAGPAIGDRWQTPAFELGADHPAWELEAHYLALALRTFICTLSPQRIVLGGGVMEQPQLFPLVRRKTVEYLNGYVQSPAILHEIDGYIVPPGLGNRAGVLGALALGMAALG
ncbi:MAG: ROK family protein [Chloroflexota bacterium]